MLFGIVDSSIVYDMILCFIVLCFAVSCYITQVRRLQGLLMIGHLADHKRHFRTPHFGVLRRLGTVPYEWIQKHRISQKKFLEVIRLC